MKQNSRKKGGGSMERVGRVIARELFERKKDSHITPEDYYLCVGGGVAEAIYEIVDEEKKSEFELDRFNGFLVRQDENIKLEFRKKGKVSGGQKTVVHKT